MGFWQLASNNPNKRTNVITSVLRRDNTRVKSSRLSLKSIRTHLSNDWWSICKIVRLPTHQSRIQNAWTKLGQWAPLFRDNILKLVQPKNPLFQETHDSTASTFLCSQNKFRVQIFGTSRTFSRESLNSSDHRKCKEHDVASSHLFGKTLHYSSSVPRCPPKLEANFHEALFGGIVVWMVGPDFQLTLWTFRNL